MIDLGKPVNKVARWHSGYHVPVPHYGKIATCSMKESDTCL